MLALAVGLLAGTPASPAELPSGGMTAGEVAGWLVRAGLPAEVKPDITTPVDQTVSTRIDGLDVDIYFYGCKGEGDARRCVSLQFAAGWAPRAGVDAARANAWNAANRYVRAYVTAQGQLGAEYDIDVSPGGTSEMLDDSLGNWRSLMRDFRRFFAVPAETGK